MPSLADQVKAAFEAHVHTPIAQLTLGAALKAMLEFYRDDKFAWADPEGDSVCLEWDTQRGPGKKSPGFLGFFQAHKPGDISAYTCTLSRLIFAAPTETQPDASVTLSLGFNYPAEADIAAAASSQNELDSDDLDSDEFESFEAFVEAALKTPAFKALALRHAGTVTLELESFP